MVANNMSELEHMLMERLKLAMDDASILMLDDTQKEVKKFYTRGKPKLYSRTGTLGNTPDVSPLSVSGKQVSFKVFLDQSHGYRTGTFSMGEVLEHAESTHYRAGILGKPKFWMDSEKRMKKTFERTIKKYFR